MKMRALCLLILAAALGGASPALAFRVGARTPAHPRPYTSLRPPGGQAGKTATETPEVADARIRVLDYRPDAVLTVPVSRGVVTRIVLAPDEKIIAAATGVAGQCEVEGLAWCIVADQGTNALWIKPMTGASRNNLEVKTDRHDYSFELITGAVRTYRVDLRYPPTEQGDADQARVAERLAESRPVPRNRDYRLEANRKGADIMPRDVFDDGTFTYFRFPGAMELPTVFVIGADGQEARTNYSMQDDYLVVQRLGRRFILRLGKSTVSVLNAGFTAEGAANTSGTSVPGVRREIAGGQP